MICGGESGQKARPFDVAWARSVIRQCKAAGVAVFCKQLGACVVWDGISGPDEHWPSGTMREDTGHGHFLMRLRDRAGGDLSEWPEDLRVREWPASQTDEKMSDAETEVSAL